MKRTIMLLLVAAGMLTNLRVAAQNDKSKRPSPPALVKQKINSGATLSIDYSQPSVKGRMIGKDLEPLPGQVWRTGANEATVFETDKDIMVAGNKLPAGKYGLFTVYNDKDVTVIFNKTWNQWGAFKYNAADDQLRIKAYLSDAGTLQETLKFNISPAGVVTLLWGTRKVTFDAK